MSTPLPPTTPTPRATTPPTPHPPHPATPPKKTTTTHTTNTHPTNKPPNTSTNSNTPPPPRTTRPTHTNLTSQVRNIAEVTTAVANGNLSKKITVDVKGEILALKNTINTMVDQLSSFASEVTRVAREVGSEGKLGGQAQVKGVAGTWKDLTDNVNSMASK